MERPLYNIDKPSEFRTFLRRVDLDEARKYDLANGKGFVIESPKGIINNLKSETGVFSPKFGQTLQDLNPFADKYKCKCGNLMGNVYDGIICPDCKEPVKFIDNDLSYFGWIVLKNDYHVIHPNMYKSIEYLIGKQRLSNILTIKDIKDENGVSIAVENKPDEPFSGIGMIGFKDNFDEILAFYLKKFPNKVDTYNDIITHRHIIFTHSIPVYSTILRPFQEEGKMLFYEDNNEIYVLMARLAHVINDDRLRIGKKSKPKDINLYSLQVEFNKLYDELLASLSGKKGNIRNLMGARCIFTSRNVIVPLSELRIDEVKLSYFSLAELLQQRIINILQKANNMGYDEAYNKWYSATVNEDADIRLIIESIISNYERGIPIIINRNPTIAYGGILQVFVVGIQSGYTMAVPLQILSTMAADFDGDALNIRLIINEEFFRYANKVFNPRNVLLISRNDGLFNNSANHSKDVIVNLNKFSKLSRGNYTHEELQLIYSVKG